MSQMYRINGAGQPNVGWDLHVVIRLTQQPRQKGGGCVVVEVEPHDRISFAHSWGDSGLGLAWSLYSGSFMPAAFIRASSRA